MFIVERDRRIGGEQGEEGGGVPDGVTVEIVERLDRPEPVKLDRPDGGFLAQLADRRVGGGFAAFDFNRAAHRLPRPGERLVATAAELEELVTAARALWLGAGD